MLCFNARGKFLSMAMFVSFNLRENGEERAFSIQASRSLLCAAAVVMANVSRLLVISQRSMKRRGLECLVIISHK